MILRALMICLLMACSLSGCDWVKSKLGMATSEDIERMKKELEEKSIRERRTKDSLERVRRDSLQRTEVLAAVPEGLQKRFYVIVGSYTLKSNADNMYARVEKLGLKPSRIMLRNGYEMIESGGGFDRLPDACAHLNKLYHSEDFSVDVWIYDAREGLHLEKNN